MKYNRKTWRYYPLRKDASLGERLRYLLYRRGYTHKWLAQRTGLYPSSIENWLYDASEPGAKALFLMAKALDTTTDFLVGPTNSEQKVGQL